MTDPLAEAIAFFKLVAECDLNHEVTLRHAKTLVDAARAMQPADDLVEAVGMALCQSALGSKQCPCAEKGKFSCSDAYPGYQARAVIPIAQAPVLAQLADERRKSEALAAALRNIKALAMKRQAEGGPDGNLAAIEGFADAGLAHRGETPDDQA